MTILSLDTQRDIRNAAMSALHYIAFEMKCEVSDVIATLPMNSPETATQSTAASVSEPRSGQPTPGKDASRTVPQASHADNREAVTGPHRESGETNSGATGGRQLQPALRTGVAPGAVDTHPENAAPVPQAGEPRNSPAPNPDQGQPSPPPSAVPNASEPPSDAAGEAQPLSASPAPIKRTKKSLVADCHAAHPDWTSGQIAEALGLTRNAVCGHLSALGIKLERKPTYQKNGNAAPAEPTEAVLTPSGRVDTTEPVPAAPEAPPAALRPSDVEALQARGRAYAERVAKAIRPLPAVEAPAPKPAMRKPASKFVRLHDKTTGLYLGSSIASPDGELVMMQKGRDTLPYLWRGTREQLKAVRAKFPSTFSLHAVAVEDQAKMAGW